MDLDGDFKLNFVEFKKRCFLLKAWGIKIEDPKKSFEEMDENLGGFVMQNEFCDWIVKKASGLRTKGVVLNDKSLYSNSITTKSLRQDSISSLNLKKMSIKREDSLLDKNKLDMTSYNFTKDTKSYNIKLQKDSDINKSGVLWQQRPKSVSMNNKSI